MRTFIIICCLSMGLSQSGYSQNNKEILNQVNQIAALQVYLGYLIDGYKIVRDGLDLIGSFKDGEFTLHKNFFASLRNINPEIAKYARISDVITMQEIIVRDFNQVQKQISAGGLLNTKEQAVVRSTYIRILENCGKLTTELKQLTTANKYELEDANRIRSIDKVFEEMDLTFHIAKDFKSRVTAIQLGRERDKHQINRSRKLYHLN